MNQFDRNLVVCRIPIEGSCIFTIECDKWRLGRINMNG